MSTDYKGKVFNSMTQARFNELLANNGGKLPAAYANSYVYTDAEDVNLSQLRTEVVYDMNNPNKQLGQPNGILAGDSVSGDFSKYDRLKVYCQGAGEVSSRIYEIDLSKPAAYVKISGYPYMGVGTDTSFDDIANNASSIGIYFDISLVNTDKTTFMHYKAGYTVGSTPTYRNSSYGTYRIYKIEGILKTPAVIYTGKELFAGNGIAIEDGIISQTIIPKARYIGSIGGGRSYTGTGYSTVNTATITTTGGRLFITISPQVHVNANMLYLYIFVDGTQYAELYSNRQSVGTIAISAITPELSAGVHTVELKARGQKDGNTVSFDSYCNGSFVIMEV